jgi:hypothetical protein
MKEEVLQETFVSGAFAVIGQFVLTIVIVNRFPSKNFMTEPISRLFVRIDGPYCDQCRVARSNPG